MEENDKVHDLEEQDQKVPDKDTEKIFENGDKYLGEWVLVKDYYVMEGEGKYTWKNGTTYRGTWQNNK